MVGRPMEHWHHCKMVDVPLTVSYGGMAMRGSVLSWLLKTQANRIVRDNAGDATLNGCSGIIAFLVRIVDVGIREEPVYGRRIEIVVGGRSRAPTIHLSIHTALLTKFVHTYTRLCSIRSCRASWFVCLFISFFFLFFYIRISIPIKRFYARKKRKKAPC